MNRDRIEGQFRQSKGALRQHWGRLTGNAAMMERGERERLNGKRQKTWGLRQQEAKQQIRELQAQL